MLKNVNLVITIFFIYFFSTHAVFAQNQALKNVEGLILKEAYAQAAEECRQILHRYHQAGIKSKAYYLLGICLLKEAAYPQAREKFKIILRRYARSQLCDDARLGLADSYFLAGEYQQAEQKYRQFLQDFPRSELTSIARKHLQQCKQGKGYVNSYFSVQVGCFSKKKNAQNLRDELINSGYQAQILQWQSENMYRVRVGRFNTRLQAELLEQRLKAKGYTTKVCP